MIDHIVENIKCGCSINEQLNFLLFLTLNNENLNTKGWFSYLKMFNYVWNNWGIEISFSNSKFNGS